MKIEPPLVGIMVKLLLRSSISSSSHVVIKVIIEEMEIKQKFNTKSFEIFERNLA